MRDRSDGPWAIRSLLTSVGSNLGVGSPVETGVVWSHWRAIVGDAIAEHVEPTSLRRGVLKIRADSPAWATEVGYLTDAIRTRVNAEVGKPLVEEVRVWAGGGAVATHPQRAATPPRSETPRPAPNGPVDAFNRARRAWSRRRSS